MKKIQAMACMTAIALTGTLGFSACSSDTVEEASANVVFDENGTAGVKPEFVISIPRSVVGSTRMSNAVTQNEGSVEQFRGLDNIRLIAFAGEPTASSQKLSDVMRLSAISSLSSPGAINYKVYADQFVPVGTRNFLFYAKAINNSAEEDATQMSMDDKFKYGVLLPAGLTDAEFTSPSSITFSLQPINTSTERQAGNATGQNIVALLNSLANTTVSDATAPNDAWKTTNNLRLASLYRSFTATSIASSNSLAGILSSLYFSLAHVDSSDPAFKLAVTLRDKVLTACDGEPVSGNPAKLKSAYDGYPQNIGLPEGAARVKWNAAGQYANSFIDVTANYGQGNKVNITDYAYPAALWYYVSTPLKAAKQLKAVDYESAGNWDGVINSVYGTAADEVQDATQSVALVHPAEYAVGRLETRVAMGDGTFYDGAGEAVNIGDGFTLKGMLIGGQCSTGYDFTTLGNENLTIYDRNMSAPTLIAKPGTTTAANQTLALQTKADQTVKVALELVNNASDFMGADGIIAKGATFYLTATLDPTTASNYAQGTLDKIVMKDYVTKITVNIKNGSQTADRNDDGNPDVYVKDDDGNPIGVDADGDGQPDDTDGDGTPDYDIDGDGDNDDFITDPDNGGPGWDTDGDGEVDIPVLPDDEGNYPDQPGVDEGLGSATNGTPDLTSPGVELGTSVNLEWKEGLILNPAI